MEAKLEFLFFDKCSKEEYHDFHKHHCCELVYYINGKGSTIINGKKYMFYKNSFSFMPANTVHDRRFNQETDIISIAFLHNLPIDIEAGVYFDPDEKIYSYLYGMKQEFLHKKSHFQLILNSVIIEILVKLDRRINLHKISKEENNFDYIKNYIDVHYNEKIDLANLAELSFYSYHRFRHRFKELSGLSPNQYIIKKRIEGAAEMLKSTDKKVSEVAMDCGFATTAQFCQLFKKHVLKTPVEYRKEESR